MFHISHIINSTQLIKNFTEIAKYLQDINQPLLVTQKNGSKMVLISADMYEAMSCQHLEDSDNQNQMPFLAEILAKKKC